jgi:hypothetical protein
MKRQYNSHNKSKSRSAVRSASAGLIDFLRHKYEHTIPVSFVTATHKMFGRNKPLTKEDRFVKRFSDSKGNIDTNKFSEYLSAADVQERGKGLTEEAVRRVYANTTNQDGKLTFEYIMKMGENCGVNIDERTAKAIVRKFGNRKDHLSVEDCMRVNKRRMEAANAPRRK